MSTPFAPKIALCEVQYTPPALIWKLEKLLQRIAQETGFAKVHIEVVDNAVKRFECGESFLMAKVEEEYRLAMEAEGKAA